MTTEERVMTLFAEANPVPVLDDIAPPTSAPRYLNTIQLRSSTMTLIDTETQPQQRGTKRWALVAAAAAVVLALVGGLMIATRDDAQEPVPADQPEPTTPAVEAAPQPFPGSTFQPGRYETDLLGVPITYSTDRTWDLVFARPGEFFLGDPNFDDPDFDVDDLAVARVVRLGGWNTRAQAADPTFRQVGTINPNDIDSWIAANDVNATPRPDTRVGGRPTTVHDIDVDPTSEIGDGICPPEDQPCFWYYNVSPESFDPTLSRRDGDGLIFGTATTRAWLVTIEGFDPILITAFAGTNNKTFLDEFEATTVASIELGPDGPPQTL